MPSLPHILNCILLLAFVGPAVCADTPDEGTEAQADHGAFQQLLAQVDPPSLHAALHDYSPKKFKHGMFPEDRTAVEAIHKEEPGVATGILKMAHLAKRQAGNGTVPTPNGGGQQEPATTPVRPVPQGPQSTSQAGGNASPTPTSSSPANSPTSSPSPSSSPSLTAGQVITTTNAQGYTIISTVGGGATTLSPSGSSSSSSNAGPSSLTSTMLHTSTLPNGEQSTITAVTVVGASGGQNPTGTAGASPGKTSSGQPGLQTGEAVMTRGCGKEMAVVLGAAVGVAFML